MTHKHSPEVSAADKIAALRWARQEVDEYGRGICFALPSSRAGDVMTRYISDALGKHAYLSDWVRNNRSDLPVDRDSMRVYRLAWIDWMIACLEGKEPQP